MNEVPKDFTSGEALFANTFDMQTQSAYLNSKAHGFWDVGAEQRNKGEMIALMHSELSECLEGVRKPQADDKLPQYSMEATELADTIIRIMDYAGGFNIPLGEIIVRKMHFNSSRPHKHGKNF